MHGLKPTISSSGNHLPVCQRPQPPAKASKLGKFNVYDILCLQEQKYGRLELVVRQFCIPALQEAVGHHCYMGRQIDPTEPDRG